MDFAKILSKIDSIQSTKQLNESAKPDFLDIDKDGDRKEPMKKAAADKKKRDVKEDAVNEVSAPGQEDWIKKNKQRFIDQYGKKKGMEVLYATAWKRSKKVDEARQLEECYGQAMQSMSNTMDDRSGMNVSSSMDTRTGSKTLTVSAEGDAADQLAQMLKLSGLVGGTASSQDVELEEYANEPAPQVQGIETQLQQGNDLNRPKKMTPHGYQNGDNPLAMDVREQEELSALTQALSEELAGIKVDKSKVPAYQRKQQGGDWKTTQQDLQRERERNISGAEGLAALKKKQGVAEGSAHGYNVAKWYEKNGDQLKLTRWLRKEAGLPKDAPVYFDDADLVYGDKTIVPGALVNPTLKFNDLLTALTQATGGQGKQNVDGVYRESGVAEGTYTRLNTYRVKDPDLIDLLSIQDGAQMEMAGNTGILVVDTISFPKLARMAAKLAQEKKIESIAGHVTRDITGRAISTDKLGQYINAPSPRDPKPMSEGDKDYSAKKARAGQDIGKPGKQFAKIAKTAGEKYGSELGEDGMGKNYNSGEDKEAQDWLKDPKLETQVLKLIAYGIKINAPEKGIKGIGQGTGLGKEYYDYETTASNPMYFKEFLKYLIKNGYRYKVKGIPTSDLQSSLSEYQGVAEGIKSSTKK